MKMKMMMLMMLMLMLCASSPLASATDVDFFYLVLMWPGAYCSQSACCRPTTGMPAKDFFIRGLWTYSEDGKPVTKCNRIPFDPTELEGFEPDMQRYWSSIRCPSNDGSLFWKNAWKTYGTCSGMSQMLYFETALDLRDEVDVLASLTNKGITPSKSRKYTVESIEKAIEERIRAKPVIRCNKGGQVYEIYICVDDYGHRPIECPVKPHFSCPSEVIFAPFTDNMLKLDAYNPTISVQ